jgi:nucleoside-diphosphate-sugar epimerase
VKILIIGGTRFVGPAVVRELAGGNHEVTILHRGRSEVVLPSNVRHIHADRNELSVIQDDLRLLGPDVVIDMRPMSEDDVYMVQGALRGVARKLVALSSVDVYRAYGRLFRSEPGQPDPVPLTEESPLRAEAYPVALGFKYEKRDMEKAALADDRLPAVILRLPMIYGPGDEQHRFLPYLKRMDDKRPAALLSVSEANWRRSRIYVDDAAHAVVLAATGGVAGPRVYNVGERDDLSVIEWVRLIAQHVGFGGEVLTVPDRVGLYGGHFDDLDYRQDMTIDSGRIRAELGYREITRADEAMKRTIEWERENQPESLDPELFNYSAEDELLIRRDW